MPESVPAPPPGAEPAPARATIVARSLRRTFGDEVALADLDLDIMPGTIFGFVGPSGSGKTTAVRLLTGIDQATGGEVSVLGRPPAEFDAALRRRIGYMPQQSVLFPNLSVRENLSFAASLYGLPLRRRDLLDQALEQIELFEHSRKPVRSISGGMQRRLALAAALVHDPEVVFLDEPSAGIDPVLRKKLWERFGQLRDEGRTLFVTTQYVGEAAYCDTVGVLSAGRLIATDTPDALRRRAFGGDLLELVPREALDGALAERIAAVPGVRSVERLDQGGRLRVRVDSAEQQLPALQQWADEEHIEVVSLSQDIPPFDDVFVALLRDHDSSAEPAAMPEGAR